FNLIVVLSSYNASRRHFKMQDMSAYIYLFKLKRRRGIQIMSGLNEVLAINTENAPSGNGLYSQAVAFSHYNHLSAQLPVDPKTGKLVAGGVEAQAKQSLQNIKAIVESNGHVLSDVVRLTVFVTNIKDVDAVEDVCKSFYPTYVPTQTVVAVDALQLDALVQ